MHLFLWTVLTLYMPLLAVAFYRCHDMPKLLYLIACKGQQHSRYWSILKSPRTVSCDFNNIHIICCICLVSSARKLSEAQRDSCWLALNLRVHSQVISVSPQTFPFLLHFIDISLIFLVEAEEVLFHPQPSDQIRLSSQLPHQTLSLSLSLCITLRSQNAWASQRRSNVPCWVLFAGCTMLHPLQQQIFDNECMCDTEHALSFESSDGWSC